MGGGLHLRAGCPSSPSIHLTQVDLMNGRAGGPGRGPGPAWHGDDGSRRHGGTGAPAGRAGAPGRHGTATTAAGGTAARARRRAGVRGRRQPIPYEQLEEARRTRARLPGSCVDAVSRSRTSSSRRLDGRGPGFRVRAWTPSADIVVGAGHQRHSPPQAVVPPPHRYALHRRRRRSSAPLSPASGGAPTSSLRSASSSAQVIPGLPSR